MSIRGLVLISTVIASIGCTKPASETRPAERHSASTTTAKTPDPGTTTKPAGAITQAFGADEIPINTGSK
jgi:hypothetical protein